MENLVKVTYSPGETKEIGFLLGQHVQENMVFLLDGDLGAGKTTFTQGLAKGMGITRTVKSPTFNILKIYNGRIPLYHIDAYRLEGLHQDLGFDELIDDDGLVVIEWSQFIQELIPEEYLTVSIHLIDEDTREISLTAKGQRYNQLLENLK